VYEFGGVGSARRCTGHAVLQVFVEQVHPDALQRLGDGGQLGEDVDAVGVVVDHPLQAANLSLDAPEAGEHLLFVVVVAGGSVHAVTIPLGGIWVQRGRRLVPTQDGRSVKTGLRFSRKAAMPSWASCVIADVLITSMAYAYAGPWSRPICA